MQSPIAMGPPPALESVALEFAVQVPRSITQRLRLDHLQGAASIVAPPFAITTIILTIVAGPLRPSTSWTARFKVDFGCSLQTF